MSCGLMFTPWTAGGVLGKPEELTHGFRQGHPEHVQSALTKPANREAPEGCSEMDRP